jgi:transposase-like protein
VDVAAPKECPHCSGIVRVFEEAAPAEHLQEDISKKLGSSDDAFHADETYWTLNGDRAYYWVHCDARFSHF